MRQAILLALLLCAAVAHTATYSDTLGADFATGYLNEVNGTKDSVIPALSGPCSTRAAHTTVAP
jgi:hypothetical protein